MNIPAVQQVQPNFGAAAPAQSRKEADKKQVNNQNSGISTGKAIAYTVGSAALLVGAYKGYNHFFGKSEAAADAVAGAAESSAKPIIEAVTNAAKEVENRVNGYVDKFKGLFSAKQGEKVTKVAGDKTLGELKTASENANSALKAFTDKQKAVTDTEKALTDKITNSVDKAKQSDVNQAVADLRNTQTPLSDADKAAKRKLLEDNGVIKEFDAAEAAKKAVDDARLPDPAKTDGSKLSETDTLQKLTDDAQTAKTNYETGLTEHGIKDAYDDMVTAQGHQTTYAEAINNAESTAKSGLDALDEAVKARGNNAGGGQNP